MGRMIFDGNYGEAFDVDAGELVVGLSLAIPPDSMAQALSRASARGGDHVGDPRTFAPAWSVLIVHGLPVESDDQVKHQMVMSADFAFLLLGSLQAWTERARRGLSPGVCDQLDAMRADSYARWRDAARRHDRG